MSLITIRIFVCGLLICSLSSCFHPPYNNFKHEHAITRRVVGGTVVGGVAGAIVSGTVTGTLVGGAVGGVAGAAIGLQKESRPNIIKELKRQDIQYVAYGDTMTLVVPTDKYFMFHSPRLNELCYPGLLNIVKLLKFHPNSPVYVAGFTDNVGSRIHKKLLSQAQAETMLTFLWAHHVKAQQLKAEGYGDKNDIADNKLIHGSALNRRVEIQWFSSLVSNAPPSLAYMTK